MLIIYSTILNFQYSIYYALSMSMSMSLNPNPCIAEHKEKEYAVAEDEIERLGDGLKMIVCARSATTKQIERLIP